MKTKTKSKHILPIWVVKISKRQLAKLILLPDNDVLPRFVVPIDELQNLRQLRAIKQSYKDNLKNLHEIGLAFYVFDFFLVPDGQLRDFYGETMEYFAAKLGLNWFEILREIEISTKIYNQDTDSTEHWFNLHEKSPSAYLKLAYKRIKGEDEDGIVDKDFYEFLKIIKI